MSNKAEPIWRAARRAQHPTLPPCPKDLSEPQYAALVFEPICQSCGEAGAYNIHYRLRTRHCKACYSSNVVTGDIIRELRSLRLPFPLYKLPDLVPSESVRLGSPNRMVYIGLCFSLTQVRQIIVKYASLRNSAAQKAYINSRIASINVIREHAEELTKWKAAISLPDYEDTESNVPLKVEVLLE
ncbi:hypothetical protein FRC02_005629 [Tulasnella sp. 418]|nr:hypothetical protein FRC02_005629 [Tulasnella sp. 418]